MAQKIPVPRDLMDVFEKLGIPSQAYIPIQHYFADLEKASAQTGSFKIIWEGTDSEYTPSQTDDELFVDTDAGDVTINMPEGPAGKNYRIVNVGSSGNSVFLNPVAGVKLLGSEDTDYLADSEAAIFTYSITYGWY